MKTYIRVNGKLRKYEVLKENPADAIAIVNAAVLAERIARPGKIKASVALCVIEGIGGA